MEDFTTEIRGIWPGDVGDVVPRNFPMRVSSGFFIIPATVRKCQNRCMASVEGFGVKSSTETRCFAFETTGASPLFSLAFFDQSSSVTPSISIATIAELRPPRSLRRVPWPFPTWRSTMRTQLLLLEAMARGVGPQPDHGFFGCWLYRSIQ